MKDIPVYRFPAEHARENGELELYRASNKANACLLYTSDAADD